MPEEYINHSTPDKYQWHSQELLIKSNGCYANSSEVFYFYLGFTKELNLTQL